MSTESNLLPSGLPRIDSLEMIGITKRFPGVLANDSVNFDVKSGEIHALLGENGAGKSTLMKILYGLYQPEEGEIRLNRKPIRIQSPQDSIRQGIGMIHQHFMLVETLTVAENVALGLKAGNGIRLDLGKVSQRIQELSQNYNLKVDPNAIVGDLAVGEQQRVEIIKALYRGAALMVLDEPTAVLTPQEVDELFAVFRQMAADGHALIFISHKLHEILALTDRVTVLRNGKVTGSRETVGATKEHLASMMVGRDVILERDKAKQESGDVRLEVQNINATNRNGVRVLKNVSLKLRSGEIVGVAGVSGNGQKALAEAIAGLRKVESGHIAIEGKDVTDLPPAAMLDAGLSYIPEERMHDGAIKNFTVAENLMLSDHGRAPYARGIFMQFNKIADHAKQIIKNYEVKTPSMETPIKNLSGGNIQKLILGRELARQPRVLIAAQPTRGVDIGAIEYIHERLLHERENGLATLLISEDLDEVRALSDRIVVMFDGEVMGVVNNADTTVEELGLMMAGERQKS
ncbi:MAG: ABC transporter ATP-binding protein [Chloroflexota bacterium]